MRLRIALFGAEVLSIELGSIDEPDDLEHQDHTGTVAGFVPPPAVPSFVDLPDRDL